MRETKSTSPGDDRTGDVVLSTHPGARSWAEFFDLLREIDVPEDFMSERPMNVPPDTRGVRLVRSLPWDVEAADYYADIRHQLTSEGQPIGDLDMMIAAHSLSAGASLVTNNTRHHSRINAPLALVNWADDA